MLRIEDLGPVVYGGVVAGADYLDEQRITDGSITNTDFFKKYGTYAYLVPGLVATGMNAFDKGRQYEDWVLRVQSGFLFGLPGYVRTLVKDYQGTEGEARSKALREAQNILNRANTKELASGQRTTARATAWRPQAVGV